MKQRYLTTRIWLPPGPLSASVVRELLRRVFEDYQWFRPERFGRAFIDQPLVPEHVDYEALITYYEQYRTLTVAARTDRDFLLISPAMTDRLHAGGITWETSVKQAEKPAWREAHRQQVLELVRLVKSPLAQAGEARDLERKRDRLVPNPDGFGQELTLTVRDYSEGLAGLFWRNFFGRPFTWMFGERLGSLPGEFKKELADGIVLVQPYELPTQAGSATADALEQQLIAHLGPECFYDHERHLKPTRLPALGGL